MDSVRSLTDQNIESWLLSCPSPGGLQAVPVWAAAALPYQVATELCLCNAAGFARLAVSSHVFPPEDEKSTDFAGVSYIITGMGQYTELHICKTNECSSAIATLLESSGALKTWSREGILFMALCLAGFCRFCPTVSSASITAVWKGPSCFHHGAHYSSDLIWGKAANSFEVCDNIFCCWLTVTLHHQACRPSWHVKRNHCGWSQIALFSSFIALLFLLNKSSTAAMW